MTIGGARRVTGSWLFCGRDTGKWGEMGWWDVGKRREIAHLVVCWKRVEGRKISSSLSSSKFIYWYVTHTVGELGGLVAKASASKGRSTRFKSHRGKGRGEFF
jgi:hypothetical protein